jgi:hypothetical protein
VECIATTVQYNPIPRPWRVSPYRASSTKGVYPIHSGPLKRRKSAPRTIYEQNPPVFSRNATGRFTVVPPPASTFLPIAHLDISDPLESFCAVIPRCSPSTESYMPRMDSITPLPVFDSFATINRPDYSNSASGTRSAMIIPHECPYLDHSSVLPPRAPAQPAQMLPHPSYPDFMAPTYQTQNHLSPIYNSNILAYPGSSPSPLHTPLHTLTYQTYLGDPGEYAHDISPHLHLPAHTSTQHLQ